MHRYSILTLAFLLAAAAGAAEAGPPLLIEGKKTLFQRVLTRPGAALAAKPGEAGGKPQVPFSAYFVYQRVQEGGATWLQVGAGSEGTTQGFLREADTVAWNHAITLAFSPRSNRERVLFFRDSAALGNFLNVADPRAETQRVLTEFAAKGRLDPASPVIAAEPERYVDPQKQFYLLPVLSASSTVLKSGFRVRLARVASVTLEEVKAAPESKAPAAKDAAIVNYTAAVMFLIDATLSMQPYIDRTRKAVDEVLRQAEQEKLTGRIRFGAAAYQDDPAKTQGMEYLAKIFADPTNTNREQLLAAMGKIQATKKSTRAFAEDGYAGLDEVLRKVNWAPYGGRYIVFITDASSREGSSPLAATKLSTAQMRTQAQERGVAIFALHLKTPEGQKDHAVAEAQYKQLTTWHGQGPLYFPVEAGDPARFEHGVKRMATALMEQVRAPAKALQEGAPKVPGVDPMKDSVDAVGRAMVLAYLGRQQGERSPPLYEAWASDRDPANRDVPSFTVRVLLTKNQLSDLQNTLRRLLEAGEKAQLDPANFFNQLRSAAVAMGRDPSKLGQGKARNLEQAGIMGEYLEGLPYQSQLMGIDFNTWTNMSVGQSQAILDGIRSKIALYQRFHDDVDRWVKLNPAAGDGDRVYPVPIDSLP